MSIFRPVGSVVVVVFWRWSTADGITPGSRESGSPSETWDPSNGCCWCGWHGWYHAALPSRPCRRLDEGLNVLHAPIRLLFCLLTIWYLLTSFYWLLNMVFLFSIWLYCFIGLLEIVYIIVWFRKCWSFSYAQFYWYIHSCTLFMLHIPCASTQYIVHSYMYFEVFSEIHNVECLFTCILVYFHIYHTSVYLINWYSRWTNYSNPGQLYPPRPPNFKVVFFFQGLRRVDKTNQTPQHDISRTRSLTLTFGEGGRPILSSRFEYFVHLRSRNVGCLWDASILCRKNGIIAYIEYTSNSFLNFCFLLHHHMSSKGSVSLGDLFDIDMDLGSHKTSQQWTSCRKCCVFPAPFCLACDMVVFLHGFLLHMQFYMFSQRLFACRANRLCFCDDSCYWCTMPRVFTVPFHLSCE